MKATIRFDSRTKEAERFIREISEYPGVAVTTVDDNGFYVILHSFNNAGAEVIRRAERQFNQ